MRLGVGAALVGGELVGGDVEVLDGRIAAVGVGAPGGSLIAVPGFVDLQVNGCAGVDFSAPGEEGYEVAGAALLADGVTAFQPTIVTAAVESMVGALARVPAARAGEAGAAADRGAPRGPVHLPVLARTPTTPERSGRRTRRSSRSCSAPGR